MIVEATTGTLHVGVCEPCLRDESTSAQIANCPRCNRENEYVYCVWEQPDLSWLGADEPIVLDYDAALPVVLLVTHVAPVSHRLTFRARMLWRREMAQEGVPDVRVQSLGYQALLDVARRRSTGVATQRMVTHHLTVPDELLDWGRAPEQVCRWYRPWAHELQHLIDAHSEPCRLGPDCPRCDASQTHALVLSPATERKFWSRLEALVTHAVHDGRPDLLLGLDTYTADRLGLKITLQDGPRTVQIGKGLDWSFQTVERLVNAAATPETVAFIEAAQAEVQDSFPAARIGAILSPDHPADVCAGCKQDPGNVVIESKSGSKHCAECWRFLTTPWPRVEYRGAKAVVTRRPAS